MGLRAGGALSRAEVGRGAPEGPGPSGGAQGGSIHSGCIAAVHNVPLSVLIRPLPSVLDPAKVQSLVDTIRLLEATTCLGSQHLCSVFKASSISLVKILNCICQVPYAVRTQTACPPSMSSGSKEPRVVTTSTPSGAVTVTQPTSSCSERPSLPSLFSPPSRT
ncbi:sulfiredoxin-1 isoform X1 [Sturnira hondurensis]|uniref:sulfiredoxin-1 isoform X1 n=1 Tax=Sturnira hondurensis TaxID=192404 RepID=UPI00187B08A2|nr:sulfiredoxin-1 isoform X1 [Sturnira hondurensis]